MIELFSTQFWMAVLFVFQFVLVVFLFVLSKKMNQLKSFSGVGDSEKLTDETRDPGLASKYAADVVDMLEPLLRDARKTAQRFDEQIKEKKRLLKELNEALDDRIININLLLSRAETQHNKMIEKHTSMINVAMPESVAGHHLPEQMAADQQRRIIQMYDQQMDMDTIAQKLSVPRGEVQMVIDLKKKFLEMERSHP